MIKKLLLGITTTSLLMGLGAYSAFAVTLEQEINLQLPSTAEDYQLFQSSTFDSLTINNANFSFDLGDGQSIKVTSPNRRPLTNSQSAVVTCGPDKSEVTLKVNSGDATTTVTITPGTGTCSSSSSASTSGGGSTSLGGGGGGGGGSYAPVIPRQTTTKTTTTTVVAPVPAPSSAPASSGVAINRDLFLGSEGADVTQLQAWLATDKSIYSEGKVTGYFGNLTVQAVRKFQAKYGISQVGRVGPATRAKLAEIFGAGKTPSAVPTPASPVAAGLMLTKALDPGARSDDVKVLQEFLAKDPVIYPEGLATGFYGPATTRAVRKFQEKYGISQVGRVGPSTLKKLQELMGSSSVAPSAPDQATQLQEQVKNLQNQLNTLQTPAPAPVPTPTPAPVKQDDIPEWMRLTPVGRPGGASVVDPNSGTVKQDDLPYWMKLIPVQ